MKSTSKFPFHACFAVEAPKVVPRTERSPPAGARVPGQSHRMFINVVHACPNACLFCVDFKGDMFYGFDLKKGHPATADEIIDAVKRYRLLRDVRQVYFCGIGEPLLRYDAVVESAMRLRPLFACEAMLAVNTSGTFYNWTPSVDFARHFDLVQVSLNAENEEKYNQICRPKFRGAYQTLMSFLRHLRRFIDESCISCRVELTVVDTSETQFLPKREWGRNTPKPDLEACRKIAEGFRWPLKTKRLLRDCEQIEWQSFSQATQSASTEVKRSSDLTRLGRSAG